MSSTKTIYWTSPIKGWARQAGRKKMFRIAAITAISLDEESRYMLIWFGDGQPMSVDLSADERYVDMDTPHDEYLLLFEELATLIAEDAEANAWKVEAQ